MDTATNSPTPETPKCPACGTPLPAGTLSGLCPACLLKQGISADTATQANQSTFEPPPIPEIAALFPQLEIVRLLGKGGMGAVYLARQASLDRMVALKILPARNSSKPEDAGFAERFTREARALAKLNHPNIVAVYEFGQAGALHYFLMEYVDGVNLRQLQKSGRMSAHEALQIVPQLCDALQYAHDEGVVHRDIKPENVLVDRKGRVKIADFGLAKILGVNPGELRLTGEGQVMGTPHYMSPEQIEHPLEVDHRTDIYSLGVVFYEMLTGELPLGRFSPPSRKVQIDVRLDDVVLRTLEKEPERRYQQISEVKTRMASITQAPGNISAPPVPSIKAQTAVETTEQVKWPAIGLIATSLLNWIILFPILLGLIVLHSGGFNFRLLIVLLLAMLINTLVFIGGLKMKRLESRGLAIAASILAMLLPPGNLLGLPVGIWALIVLTRKSVRESFGGGFPSPLPNISTPSQSNGWKIALVVGGLVILLLAIPVLAIFTSIMIPAVGKARQQAHAIASKVPPRIQAKPVNSISTKETWSPDLKPGEEHSASIDLSNIYQEGNTLMQKGKYEEALQRYLWFFNNALEYDQAQSGVRVSFVLSNWAELGRRYPRARQVLLAIRDQDLEKIENGNGYFALVQELSSIDQYLQEDATTVAMFKGIVDTDPALAAQCFPMLEPVLAKNGEYELCMTYLGQTQSAFETIKSSRKQMLEMEERDARMNKENSERRLASIAKLKKEHPEIQTPPMERHFELPKLADKNFVSQTRTLIEILVNTDHLAEAEDISMQALAVLNDPKLKSALSDAQAKMKKK